MINFGLTLDAAYKKKKEAAAKKADLEARKSHAERRRSLNELRRSQAEARRNSQGASGPQGLGSRSKHDDDTDLSTDPKPIVGALKAQAQRNEAFTSMSAFNYTPSRCPTWYSTSATLGLPRRPSRSLATTFFSSRAPKLGVEVSCEKGLFVHEATTSAQPDEQGASA